MRRSTWVVGLGVIAVVVGGAVSASAAPTATTASAAKSTVLRYDIAFRPFEENVVDVGTWRRTLVLPRVLIDAPTQGARFEDHVLQIRFAAPARKGVKS